jgi:hypothetical protein
MQGKELRDSNCVVSRSDWAFVFKMRFLRSENARSPKSHQVIGIMLAPLVEYQHCIGKPISIICSNFVSLHCQKEFIGQYTLKEALTLDYTACNARSTTTEKSRIIGIVITAAK